MSGSTGTVNSEPETSSIRRDGETQHRTTVNPGIVAEYSDLMRAGVVFPPVQVWWDGSEFWLSDGFQRIQAAELASFREITANVLHGTLSDARWDSYAANATHGVRRTAEETKRVVRLAIEHPMAANLSNVELARHLKIPETTLRRWRHKLSSSVGEDTVRIVNRGNSAYRLAISKIGKIGPDRRVRVFGPT
jgi:hypothetical protein